MTSIIVPVADLNETAKTLESLGERISKTARLSHVGSRDDVGDSKLADAVEAFDEAWGKGHEKVQDNVKVFSENTKTISDNFTTTDQEAVNALDESGEKA
ncbi:hypothetical protein [Streptomyces luteolus]|uniref:Uncharacterized protein n=1 Tax=Streptomyces luteolus TaxID=3043615 RepID=A0ABT6T381_9ACTN|nr:hypothetical protein [Streptomyces sp. B-S-A12]MDI3422325.1 hypothetical protein [Streptomyces sp. B-S-A12]